MTVLKVLMIVGAVIMGAAILYGLVIGDFMGEGKKLLDLSWGVISLIDIYIMFALFSGWIIFREKSVLMALLWVVMMMVLGSFTACVYAFIALMKSKGNWQQFWMGGKASRSD